MNTYVLQRRGHWGDDVNAIVMRAETPAHARVAAAEATNEPAWGEPILTTCEVLTGALYLAGGKRAYP